MNEPATWNPLGLTWLQIILIWVAIMAIGAIVIYVQHRRGK